jgi:hypothetical protein
MFDVRFVSLESAKYSMLAAEYPLALEGEGRVGIRSFTPEH